jgi:chromosome segregation ATPase
VSMTATVQTHAPLSGADRTARSPTARDRDVVAQAREREQLTDRLHSLRRVLPALAQEMASARRQATHLRLDNRRLTEQVRELRAELQARELRMR